MMILKEVIIVITFICLTKADCPSESPVENVTLTCYPEKNGNGTYEDETLCISQCDYNTVEHNCIEDKWDTDINNHGCLCQSLGSSRGGEWICSPTVSSITSQIQEGTRCIFKCGEESTDMTECTQRQWSKNINQFACEDGFHCSSLNNPSNGNWLCEDTYIQADTQCRLTCNSGYSAGGQDVNICSIDGNWTLDDKVQCVKITPDAVNGVLLLGGTGNAKPLQSTTFSSPSTHSCLTSLASMPIAREKSSALMTSSDNSIVLCGGADMNGDPLDTCSRYFPLEDKWDTFPSLIQPRVDHAMVYFQDKLIVLGGSGGDIDVLDSLEIYEENGWTIGIDLPLGANHTLGGACAVTSKGLLYLIGGYGGGYLGSVYVLNDVNSPEWIEKEQMYINRRKHACLVTTVNGQEGILVSGGLTGPALKSTEFYSFETESWEILGDLQVGRIGHYMAEIDGEIYALGGSGLNSTEIFDRGSNTWSMSQWQLPGDNYQFSAIPMSTCLKEEVEIK